MENHLYGKTIAYLTLGCKVNGYETEAIRDTLKGCGMTEVPFRGKADVYLVNTCTVTNIADRKSRQMLHRARKQNPDAVIVAEGCYVQEFCREGEDDGTADLYIGNRRKGETAAILNEWFAAKAEGTEPKHYYINEDAKLTPYEEMKTVSSETTSRAFMKIQDGCNQFCSYCIIPFARGRIASRKESDVLAEAKFLAESGCKEVVISGIHLSSYGLDKRSVREQSSLRTDDGSMPLISLLEKLSKIDGIERIRLGSLEPRIITKEFTDALSKIKEICPHFHLSLQSGCAKTLQRMNRRYTPEEFAEAVRLLREAFDNPALTTDIIVGFPGETEEDFKESMAFAEKIGFAQIHVFPYSRRKGTVADKMDGQLTEAVKHEREVRFLETERKLRTNYYKGLLGKTASVMVEEMSEEDGVMYAVGHCQRYGSYRFPSDTCLSGGIVEVIGEEITTDGIIQAKTVAISHKIE
ncbi:MAG: tRNA (N(6)-L-threonylcarbamoyladenosine(37)-C(2))-methylthiotransferase MtaB [Lachnospiraceae bacterium]|nr:tRNA (N(6)-L-threonylcarbamoyladenosine(37)-C(2))-methylthiotransferase MtaB [Lachnospiraceae bacterium]